MAYTTIKSQWDKIEELRKRGLKYTEIASMLGVSTNAIASYKNRVMNPEKSREADRIHMKRWRAKNPEKVVENRIKSKFGKKILRLVKSGSGCQKCHSILFLQVHHIDWDKTNNDTSNYALLCKECHNYIHNAHPPKDVIIVRFEQFMEGD